eukprot:Sspe_Gene.48455::Locus_25251_Transcript_1_1_Confidence_1.000_Length_2184::g.48455::m.48455
MEGPAHPALAALQQLEVAVTEHVSHLRAIRGARAARTTHAVPTAGALPVGKTVSPIPVAQPVETCSPRASPVYPEDRPHRAQDHLPAPAPPATTDLMQLILLQGVQLQQLLLRERSVPQDSAPPPVPPPPPPLRSAGEPPPPPQPKPTAKKSPVDTPVAKVVEVDAAPPPVALRRDSLPSRRASVVSEVVSVASSDDQGPHVPRARRMLRGVMSAYLFPHFLRSNAQEAAELRKDYKESVSVVFVHHLAACEGALKRALAIPLHTVVRDREDLDVLAPPSRFSKLGWGKGSHKAVEMRRMKLVSRVDGVLASLDWFHTPRLPDPEDVRRRVQLHHFIESLVYHRTSFPDEYLTPFERNALCWHRSVPGMCANTPRPTRLLLLVTFVLVRGMLQQVLASFKAPNIPRVATLIALAISDLVGDLGWPGYLDVLTEAVPLVLPSHPQYRTAFAEDIARWKGVLHGWAERVLVAACPSGEGAPPGEGWDDDDPSHLLINPAFLLQYRRDFYHDHVGVVRLLEDHYPELLTRDTHRKGRTPGWTMGLMFGALEGRRKTVAKLQQLRREQAAEEEEEEEKKEVVGAAAPAGLSRKKTRVALPNTWFGEGPDDDEKPFPTPSLPHRPSRGRTGWFAVPF